MLLSHVHVVGLLFHHVLVVVVGISVSLGVHDQLDVAGFQFQLLLLLLSEDAAMDVSAEELHTKAEMKNGMEEDAKRFQAAVRKTGNSKSSE